MKGRRANGGEEEEGRGRRVGEGGREREEEGGQKYRYTGDGR
jgi:hypothetical protein